MKLTYFNFPGKAEVARACLKIGGIEFEDYRMQREEWAELKPAMPMGQVPVLEDDGKVLCQSAAIDRYCARKAGLMPSDPWAAAKADELYATAGEIGDMFSATFKIQDQAEKEKARQDLVAGPLPAKFAALTKMLDAIPDGQWVGGAKISHGDLAVWGMLSYLQSGLLDGVPTTLLEDYPRLSAFRQRVASLEPLVPYLDAQTAPIYGAFK